METQVMPSRLVNMVSHKFLRKMLAKKGRRLHLQEYC